MLKVIICIGTIMYFLWQSQKWDYTHISDPHVKVGRTGFKCFDQFGRLTPRVCYILRKYRVRWKTSRFCGTLTHLPYIRADKLAEIRNESRASTLFFPVRPAVERTLLNKLRISHNWWVLFPLQKEADCSPVYFMCVCVFQRESDVCVRYLMI
jgi:hypothetical protein